MTECCFLPNTAVQCCNWNHKTSKGEYEGSPKRYRTFFFNFFLYLKLNQTCLLQSIPLYCWYTALSVFSSSGTRPGTCFAGWREGPVANFLLSPLPSEIGDLLGWTLTLGTGKSQQGPNLESRGGLGTTIFSCIAKNSRIRSDAWGGALSWCSIQVLFVHASGQNRVAWTFTDAYFFGNFTDS